MINNDEHFDPIPIENAIGSTSEANFDTEYESRDGVLDDLKRKLSDIDENHHHGDDLKESDRKTYKYRPEIWREIVVEYIQRGKSKTRLKYPEYFKDSEGQPVSDNCFGMRLLRWKKDYILEKENKTQHNNYRFPPYGPELDKELAQECSMLIAQGEVITIDALQRMLRVKLEAASLSSLLKENGGEFAFGHSWAAGFLIRHKLPSYKSRNPTPKRRKKVNPPANPLGPTFPNEALEHEHDNIFCNYDGSELHQLTTNMNFPNPYISDLDIKTFELV